MQLSPCIPNSAYVHKNKRVKLTNNKSNSPFLQSLLNVVNRQDSTESSHDSYIVSEFCAGDQEGEERCGMEELSWTKRKVVWTRGGSIYRTYTFVEQEQDVVQALFAWFEVEDRNTTTPTQSVPQNDNPSTFGPFRRPPPPAWTDDPLALPVDPTPTLPSPSTHLERSLIIFLSDIAFVYPPSGGSHPFQLPFHLRRAWAMDKGILMERAKEGKEVLGEMSAELPTLYSLLNPADEIKVVSSASALSNLFSTTYAQAKSPTEPVQDFQDRLVFASDRRDGSEPILVSVNKRTRKISVLAYGRVDTEADSFDLNEMRMDKGKRNDDQTNASTSLVQERPAPAVKRKRSSVANSSRLAAAHDRERIQRRPSAINGSLPVTGAATSEEADLLDALGGTMGAAMKRTASAISAMSAVDRRGSVTRNELSVTMDRMALGVGSSVGNGAGDMDREATLFIQEGDQTRMISDVMIERVWEIDLSQGEVNAFDNVSAYTIDSRSSSSSALTTVLAILLPTPQILLLLCISRSLEGRLVVTPIQQLSAISATPILATRSSVLDLLYLTPDSKWGAVTANGAVQSVEGAATIPDGARVSRLEGSGSSNVVINLDNGSRFNSSAPSFPAGLALRCLHVIATVLPVADYISFQSLVTSRKESTPGCSYLEAILGVIESSVGVAVDDDTVDEDPWSNFVEQSTRENTSQDYLFTALSSSASSTHLPTTNLPITTTPEEYRTLEAILLGLHLLAEDCTLIVESQHEYSSLVPSLMYLAARLGLRNWIDYYHRASGLVCHVAVDPALVDSSLPAHPLDLHHYLYSTLDRSPSTATIIDIHSIAPSFNIQASFFYGVTNPCRTTLDLISIFRCLSTTTPNSTPSSRAQTAILRLHSLGWKINDVNRLVFGIALPIREAIRLCQLESPENWPSDAYLLIRRPDLARRAGGRPAKSNRSPLSTGILEPIDVLCDPLRMANGDHEVRAAEVTRLSKATRFGEDRRLEEVERMLQFSKSVTISGGDRPLESLTPPAQQGILLALSYRTLALPIGYAMFTYRSKLEPSPEAVRVKRINLSARILPMPSAVVLIEKERGDATSSGWKEKDRLEWPEFHSGVAAALQLGFEAGDFDSSQILFNRPQDLDARHAGFLMGLGLIGQIGTMVFNQAFEYLKMKHDPTSIGLLLGLAVTYLGTGDPKVTSLLSVHLSALHPTNSSPLNVSGITQSAGLVGIGLLYLGTARQTLADSMIKELCGMKVTMVEDASACREAYALSAGFAYGFIMLGRGKEVAGEVKLIQTFRALILGDSNRPLPGLGGTANMTDVNITSSAATIALSLTFLKSERQDVADLLEIPDTPRRLDYVRADLLLLRILGRSLVMWDAVTTSKEWVESHLPPFLRPAFDASIQMKPYDTDLGLAAWNIVAGVCFGIGLKFAGTARKEAHVTLIYYLDRLTRAAYVKTQTVQGKIKRHAIRCCLSVVAVSLSMVMAGTGELNVLRRLRIAHGHFSEGVTYGTHLSSHMALGLLFLGSGQYTLGTSNSAIAALVISLYPSFPATSIENRAHLQAYRHLWTLAVEPRCITARDVDTNEASFLPIRLRLMDDDTASTIKALDLVAPTLIPELRRIESIQVDSPRYWSFGLHLASNPTHRRAFLNDSTLYVKRRTGHLSYSQDPRGNKSIFTRSKSETGSSVFDLGEMMTKLMKSNGNLNSSTSSSGGGGLREFIKAFSNDSESIATVKYLCPTPHRVELGSEGEGSNEAEVPLSEFEAFAASTLLECLTKDKPDTIALYMSIFHQLSATALSTSSSTSSTISTAAILGLKQLKLVINFYGAGIYTSVFKAKVAANASSKTKSLANRERLLQATFVDHVETKLRTLTTGLEEGEEMKEQIDRYLQSGEWTNTVSGDSRIAAWLCMVDAPDSSSLEKLKGLVLSSASSTSAPSEIEAIKLVVHGASKVLHKAGEGGWSKTLSERVVDVWLA